MGPEGRREPALFWATMSLKREPTTVKAIYEDGVFKPLEPVHLDEHTEVEVLIPCCDLAGR